MSLFSNNKDELYIDYDRMLPFPVVNGQLGVEFKVEDVFGYFVYLYDGSIIRAEGLFVLNGMIEEVGVNNVHKITRKFFWDLHGEVREWTIMERKDENHPLVKTLECDTSRIFKFDLEYLYSLNAEYVPSRWGKRLSNEAKEAKEDIGKQVFNSELDGWLASVCQVSNREKPCLSFELVSEYQHQFNRRDLSNMIKIPEDGICDNVLDNNDARNYFISNRKLFSDHPLDEGGESIYLKVTLINYWLD